MQSRILSLLYHTSAKTTVFALVFCLSNIFVLFVQRLPHRDRKLVGAGRGFKTAFDALQKTFYLLDAFAVYKPRYALKVAVAAARKAYVGDDIVFYIEVYCLEQVPFVIYVYFMRRSLDLFAYMIHQKLRFVNLEVSLRRV